MYASNRALFPGTSPSFALSPQPIHQNVDESPRARLPVRIGIAITHSDHRAQQVRWVDILANIAARAGSLHERGDRACDQFSRGRTQCRSAACRSWEGGPAAAAGGGGFLRLVGL